LLTVADTVCTALIVPLTETTTEAVNWLPTDADAVLWYHVVNAAAAEETAREVVCRFCPEA